MHISHPPTVQPHRPFTVAHRYLKGDRSMLKTPPPPNDLLEHARKFATKGEHEHAMCLALVHARYTVIPLLRAQGVIPANNANALATERRRLERLTREVVMNRITTLSVLEGQLKNEFVPNHFGIIKSMIQDLIGSVSGMYADENGGETTASLLRRQPLEAYLKTYKTYRRPYGREVLNVLIESCRRRSRLSARSCPPTRFGGWGALLYGFFIDYSPIFRYLGGAFAASHTPTATRSHPPCHAVLCVRPPPHPEPTDRLTGATRASPLSLTPACSS